MSLDIYFESVDETLEPGIATEPSATTDAEAEGIEFASLDIGESHTDADPGDSWVEYTEVSYVVLEEEPTEPADVLLELAAPDDSEEDEEGNLLLKGSLSGTVASVLLHIWLLITAAGVTFNELPALSEPVLITEFKPENPEEEPEEEIEYELANPHDRELEVREVVHAASFGLVKTNEIKVEAAPHPREMLMSEEVAPPVYDIPAGLEESQELVVKGTTGEGLVEIESALDRITWEVANNLQEDKVLLVWCIDASGSLIKQRETIVKRLNRVYGELEALDKAGQIPRREQPLLTGVVSYGEQTEFLTKDPTDNPAEVLSLIETAAIDASGRENVFRAVSQVMGMWSHYRQQQGRRIMLVIVTDESGDDFESLELAIKRCRLSGAKAYVVGPAAVFGRREGYVNYVAPEDSQTYKLPVDLGPETPMISRLALPYWYDGPSYEYLSSGFGPYGLTRLVNETGGIYFMTNMTTTETLAPVGVFDGNSLKPFEPEYSFATPEQYINDMARFPIRRAVYQACLLSMQKENEVGSTPQLDLRVTPENYRDVATRAQQQVAINGLALDTVLAAFPDNIEAEAEKDPSLRWRMSFYLAYGRALALKVRSLEYNAACADLKGGLTPDDVRTKSNHWIFRPSDKLNYAPQARRWQKTAEALLRRIVDEAPGTPWAVLAQRELKDGMGLEVVHRFIPPPPPAPPRPATNNGNAIRLAPEPRPQQPPAPPAPRPAPPKLPNL